MTLTFGVGIILILMSMLSSCSHKVRYITETVEIPRIQKEYVNRIDSVFIKKTDSIYVNRYLKADTAYVETVKVRYRDRNVVKRDTILRTDSLFVPVRYDNPELLSEIDDLKRKLDDSAVKEKLQKHTIKMYRYSVLIGALCLILFNFDKVKKLIKWLIKFIKRLI